MRAAKPILALLAALPLGGCIVTATPGYPVGPVYAAPAYRHHAPPPPVYYAPPARYYAPAPPPRYYAPARPSYGYGHGHGYNDRRPYGHRGF